MGKIYCEKCGEIFDGLDSWDNLGTESHSYQDGYAKEERGVACPCCGEENSYETLGLVYCSHCDEELDGEDCGEVENIRDILCEACEEARSE